MHQYSYLGDVKEESSSHTRGVQKLLFITGYTDYVQLQYGDDESVHARKLATSSDG